MDRLRYMTPGGVSEIFIGGDWDSVAELIDPQRTIIITDTNVSRLYKSRFPDCQILVISSGERTKSLATIEAIVADLLKLQVDRSYFLLGIGGGVVCDITGFVASVYMRGIKFGFVSTTLLSQVDASTGGKNGVNSSDYKNVIGCFSQPEFVICDPAMLKTLSVDEFKSGLGELVKHALIADLSLFEILEERSDEVKAENSILLKELIKTSIKIKIGIVEKDEKERGIRRLLNFGHTLGHAIESVSGKKHGIAVAEGIYLSSLFSFDRGFISSDDYNRIINLLRNIGLVDSKPEIQSSYIDYVKRDKKREEDIIHFALLNGIGRGDIKEVKMEEIISWMQSKM